MAFIMDKNLLKNTKDSIKLGMVSQVGSYTVGSMGANLGMKTTIPNTVNTTLGLANTGQLAKTGLSLTKLMKK